MTSVVVVVLLWLWFQCNIRVRKEEIVNHWMCVRVFAGPLLWQTVRVPAVPRCRGAPPAGPLQGAGGAVQPVSHCAAGLAAQHNTNSSTTTPLWQTTSLSADVSGATDLRAVPPAVWGVLLRRVSPV